MERDGMLYFRKVEKTDAGNYTCVAESDQGSINATINVVVYGELRRLLFVIFTIFLKGIFTK